MKILSIDTSCDETCAAVLEVKKGNFKILSNIISSQIKLHQKYGGVYPSLAKREHQRNLIPVLKKALKKAESPKIDLIAVTVGPGLEPCLWVGVNFAKALSLYWEKPIIPVNHIEAHILANLLPQISSNFKVSSFPEGEPPVPYGAGKFQELFPAICLVVSGGHTQLILMNPVRGQRNLVESQKKQTSNGVKEIGNYKIIGETRDDAAGECFDKTARILGLPYPGGPAIAEQATKLSMINNQLSINLPRPMINSKNYDFSFSGLKTAVLYDFKKRPKEVRTSKEYIREMAKEIQQAIIDVLIKKTITAAKNYQVKTIMLGGGVASNKELRKQFQRILRKEKLSFKFYVPGFKFCTDNAAMIAAAGYFNREKATKNWKNIKAKANLRIV